MESGSETIDIIGNFFIISGILVMQAKVSYQRRRAKDRESVWVLSVSGATQESMSVQPAEESSVATKGTISALSSSLRESQSMFPASASAMSHAWT